MRKSLLGLIIVSGLIMSPRVISAADVAAPANEGQEVYQKEKTEANKKLQVYMQQLEEAANKEGSIPLEKYGDGFAEAVTKSQNLAESGN